MASVLPLPTVAASSEPPPLPPGSAKSTLGWMLRLYGPLGTARLVAAKLAGRTGTSNEYAEWRDRLLDAHLGIDTAAPLELDAIAETGTHGDADTLAHAVEYRGTSGVDAAAMLSRLPIDLPSTHFVDLGCGKGRVLAIARSMPFASVTGVEFCPDLARTAEANLSTARLPQRSGPAHVIEGDARTTDWPAGPLVVYLYNPFGRAILDAVERSLAASLIAHPRPCTIVYANPQHTATFETPDWHAVATGDEWWAVYRWASLCDE